jgi:transcriptional regulator with XRE-family HTH domain
MTEAEKKYLYEFVGNKIKDLRSNNEISQLQLAEKLGMSRVSIVNIERGRQHITLHLLFKICHIFNAELNDFYPEKDRNISISSKILKEAEQIKEVTGKTISTKKLIDFIDKVGSDKSKHNE